MDLKTTLTAMVLLFYSPNQKEEKYPYIESVYKTFHELSNLEVQGLKLDIKRRRISHMNYPNFYFIIGSDHNGKPLYLLRYDFDLENVQAYFKKLQRTLQGRTVK